ncbi:hypothetical protein [Psittacicella hinzii]|uniref:Uncharacterized protein n=1 Tax=Psittacicella hinzii TaxID=2028575 RepID=A0A3A1YNV5_9GAMM|nr:hypothetical protein [Psittacicella hinzii]RIY39176.1 hypothetical protein CKF58_02740 [Psittacicella hinzii]
MQETTSTRPSFWCKWGKVIVGIVLLLQVIILHFVVLNYRALTMPRNIQVYQRVTFADNLSMMISEIRANDAVQQDLLTQNLSSYPRLLASVVGLQQLHYYFEQLPEIPASLPTEKQTELNQFKTQFSQEFADLLKQLNFPLFKLTQTTKPELNKANGIYTNNLTITPLPLALATTLQEQLSTLLTQVQAARELLNNPKTKLASTWVADVSKQIATIKQTLSQAATKTPNAVSSANSVPKASKIYTQVVGDLHPYFIDLNEVAAQNQVGKYNLSDYMATIAEQIKQFYAPYTWIQKIKPSAANDKIYKQMQYKLDEAVSTYNKLQYQLITFSPINQATYNDDLGKYESLLFLELRPLELPILKVNSLNNAQCRDFSLFKAKKSNGQLFYSCYWSYLQAIQNFVDTYANRMPQDTPGE